MRKRAGFARALVLDPDIVLFDEPDSGLDPVRTALLCELIQEIHEENGGAYVVITHDIMSAKRVAEYIAVLWKGRIVESGPAEELFNSDNQFVRQFLSGASRGPARHGVTRTSTASERRIACRRPAGRRWRLDRQDEGCERSPDEEERLSAARGIALTALVLAVAAGRATCCSSAAAAGTSTRCCSRTPASSSRTTTCRSAAAGRLRRAIELTDDNQAAVKVEVEEPYAPLREGTQAVIRADLAVGHRQPLRRAHARRPRATRELDDGATLTTASRRPTVVDLDQLFNTLDEKTRGDLQDVIQGFADAVRGQGRGGRRSRRSTSTRCCRPRACWPTSSPRTRAR